MDLEELRRAARRLEPERVVRAIDTSLARWREPDSLLRARLARDHGIYSGAVIDAGIGLALGHWTAQTLASLRAREMGEPCRVPALTAVWLAGSIPPSAFSAILLPLLAGSAVYAKPSSEDAASPGLFLESLRDADPDVARAVALGDDVEVLGRADAVVAHGSDETVATIRARVPVQRVFVGHAHKLSVAVIGARADLDDAACSLARDVALWDGRGCLSPAFAFVQEPPAGRGRAFLDALASALEGLQAELPRGTLTAGEQVSLHDLRAELAVRNDVVLRMSRGHLAWSVSLHGAGASLPPPGRLRAVPVIRFGDLADLARRCDGLAPHVSCVGQAGFDAELSTLASIAMRGGGSRVCRLGRMQLPPLDWHHDGVGPVRALIRVLDIEP